MCLQSVCNLSSNFNPSSAGAVAGYDIEDAIVMNRSSLDRGFGRCIVLKKSSTVLRKYANRTQDRIVAPVPGESCSGGCNPVGGVAS
jgi:hypothetical protein